ncbi:MAG: hypothetical protein EPO07_10035 [Verrucomicrobia bacterium]|nr:MAG: hypothetical protein EPO07_10035 [Verrucomicrobiota bacterium]
MKKIRNLLLTSALLTLASEFSSQATVFFSDTFGSSTLNSLTPAAPTSTSTAYQLSSSKTWVPTPSIASGHLTFGINQTSSGVIEAQALFAATPVALVQAGDYIELSVTFTNASGILSQGGPVGFGLYNANSVQPIAGGLNATATTSASDKATGGAQNWKGYVMQINFTGANSGFFDRQPQTGTFNNNQELLTSGSSSASYRNPSAAAVGPTTSSPSVTLTVSNQYTEILRYTLTSSNALLLESYLYTGPNNTGTLLSSNVTTTSVTPLTSAFDAFAVGWRSTGNATNSLMDINAISVTGQSTAVTTPPDILSQPLDVVVPAGAACAFQVVADGFGMTYQWKRYGTNLVNGGNISGVTSDTLVINPASAADVASGGNGYYVAVTGTGNYTTNSTKASLALGTAKNLVWSGVGNIWDLNTNANWLDGASAATFNYGDAVTLDDTASGGLRLITLIGKYLSASSVTVDSTLAYSFQASSTGSFAGPGKLIYKGTGQFTVANANTYSGGTTISNSSALLILKNYAGLGTGPVTLAKAGGLLQVTDYGNASLGINGEIIVADDFTIEFDATSSTSGSGTFSGVLLGNLSGTAGKTLTLNANPINTTTNQRVRVYGSNTTYNANLVLNNSLLTLAPYNASGAQVYNGVISGSGSYTHRGNGTSILNGQNTYSGGTIPTQGIIAFGADSVGSVTSGPIGTGPLFIAPETGSANGNGHVIAYGGARTIANAIQYPSGTNNQTLIIGGTNNLTFTGAYALNGQDGLGTATNRFLNVTNSGLTTISGVISDNSAGYGLVKLGSGTLVLGGNETYTGPTIISNGTLRVSGSLAAASAVTVATNGVLGGTGTVNGSVTVQPFGAIAPGASIGTLNLNNLTLGGNLNIEVNRSGPASDSLNVSGILTNSGTGTVNVSNVGANLQAGDIFTLFNKALTNGNALTITGGGSSVTWSNRLAVDGKIQVLAVVPTTPTNLTFNVSGNTVTLSWPGNYQGWILQSQTNNLNSGIVTNKSAWYDWPGSESVTTTNLPVNPANPTVFYRLRYPWTPYLP